MSEAMFYSAPKPLPTVDDGEVEEIEALTSIRVHRSCVPHLIDLAKKLNFRHKQRPCIARLMDKLCRLDAVILEELIEDIDSDEIHEL